VTAKPTEKLVVPGLVFVAEQRGRVEDELKGALASVFQHHHDVERAYLVRCKYGAGGVEQSVALCLVAPEQLELVEAVAAVFRARFAANVSMDTVFVSATRDAELQQVATPFYVRAATAGPTDAPRISEVVRLELAKRFSVDEVASATATLEGLTLPCDDSQAGRDRIQLAAILRSGGRLSALREAVTLTEIDWRDLLVAAGLENADWREVLRRQGVPIP
jgi:hypothetical protein